MIIIRIIISIIMIINIINTIITAIRTRTDSDAENKFREGKGKAEGVKKKMTTKLDVQQQKLKTMLVVVAGGVPF